MQSEKALIARMLIEEVIKWRINEDFTTLVPPETRVSSHRRGRMLTEPRLKTRALNPDFDEYYLADNKGIEVRQSLIIGM